MHTGALYLTPQNQPGLPACRLLHTYSLTVFLAMFVLTLLGIVVSHVTWKQKNDVGTPAKPRLLLLHPQVLMVSARQIYRRTVTSCGYLGSQQRVTFRLMDRRMLLYPLVFFCCWGPGGGST